MMTDLFDELFSEASRWDFEAEAEPSDELDPLDEAWDELLFEAEA